MEVLDITSQIIDEILLNTNKESLPYFEHNFISEAYLRAHFNYLLQHSISKESTISKALFVEGKLVGYLILERADFDSAIFGYNVFRLAYLDIFAPNPSASSSIIISLLSLIDSIENKFKIKYLTYSINANDSKKIILFNLFLQKRFYLINTLLTFSQRRDDVYNVSLHVDKSQSAIIIREVRPDDAAEIISIAKNSHKINRFHQDINLDRKKCDLLHETSAYNSVIHGFVDIIFVAESHDRVIGYYSGKKRILSGTDLVVGEATISAVSESYRGLGAFNLLDNSLLSWFNSNTDFAEMGTYINNIPVHRTWIRKGIPLVRGTYQLARFNHNL